MSRRAALALEYSNARNGLAVRRGCKIVLERRKGGAKLVSDINLIPARATAACSAASCALATPRKRRRNASSFFAYGRGKEATLGLSAKVRRDEDVVEVMTGRAQPANPHFSRLDAIADPQFPLRNVGSLSFFVKLLQESSVKNADRPER